MKNLKIKSFFFFGSLILLLGCGGVSQEEYDRVMEENARLKKEIETIKYDPYKLLSQAKINIENNDLSQAEINLNSLILNNPGSDLIPEANKLQETLKKLKQTEAREYEKEKALRMKADKNRVNIALKSMRSNYDEINGVTWYYDKSTTSYANTNSFHLYIGWPENGRPYLRFRIQYAGNDWLLINSYIVFTDEKMYGLDASGDVKRDNDSRTVWEWYDQKVDNQLYTTVLSVINSSSSKVRYVGEHYEQDRVITERERQALKRVLEAYRVIEGS
ncbi:hypothetical protein DSECCO2_333530 [anaerobic digester metagenome]